jgi:hypothetical protein
MVQWLMIIIMLCSPESENRRMQIFWSDSILLSRNEKF